MRLSSLATSNDDLRRRQPAALRRNSTAQNDDAGNTLTGGTGRDFIAGFGGSDTINFGGPISGFREIDGGTGFDTLNFSGYVTGGLVIDFEARTVSGETTPTFGTSSA